MAQQTGPKPRYTEPCNNCGLCCILELCPVAEALFPGEKAPCPALLQFAGKSMCGLVLFEQHNGLAPDIQKALGIGCGCSMPDDDTSDETITEFDRISRHRVFGGSER